jgi:hypothetical protein
MENTFGMTVEEYNEAMRDPESTDYFLAELYGLLSGFTLAESNYALNQDGMSDA